MTMAGCQVEPSDSETETSLLTGVKLVENGNARSRIVLPDTANRALRDLADELAARLAQSTGATLQVIRESNVNENDLVNIFLGQTQAAKALALENDLPEESYRFVVKSDAVYLLGKLPARPASTDAVSDPLRWAVNALLEEGVGIRYLWPGELGTFVPHRNTVLLQEKDIIWQPPLKIRVLRMPNLTSYGQDPELETTWQEGIRWAQNHRAGRRGSIRFGHAFTDWWKKYAESNPDYFALPPDGLSETDLMKVVGNNGRHAKLRLSNPAVVEQIAQDYQKAGAPEYYNVCPNDGAGYDLAPETLTWDDPQGQDLQAIWQGDANLTARYVHFWNLVSERLQQINPEVTLLTYAYWSYRHPPKATQKFHGKAVIGMVDGWDAFEAWEGWRQAGAEIYLRPNWGSYYAGAPAIHAEEIVRFMHFAHKNGMMGFDLDTIKGHWATEGFNSYVMARLMTQSDLTSDALVQEFSEAFGSAAPKIREYLNYWQEKGTEFGYPIPAGGTTGANPGKYGELQAQEIISENYYHGPHAALPHLYTDSVLAPAKKLLEEAKALLTKEETQEAERVAFLQAGLRHHELMRNALALGIRIKEGKADSAELEKFRECANELDAFRKTTPFRHLAWPSISRTENRFKSPIRPANISSAVQDTLTVD